MTASGVLSAHGMIFLFTVLGLAIGSFLNVVIHRLPRMLEAEWAEQCAELRGESIEVREPFSLARPGSRCPHCQRPIRPIENIPIISYLWLRGRCKGCNTAISARYPLVEALTGLTFGLVAWHSPSIPAASAALPYVAALIALSAIDFDTKLLPDDITLPLLWGGLLANLFGIFVPLESAVIGAIAGYLILWSVYWLYKLASGREGMGYGDFKLLAAIGAWLGWQILPFVVLISSILGALVGISLIVFTKHGREIPIPFGPYLAVAGIVALLWGKPLSLLYFGLG